MKFAYTIIYVEDVPKTVAFYERAFGLPVRFIHDSNQYAEMETGDTALTFAANEAAEEGGLAVAPNSAKSLPAAWEICLVTPDVVAAFDTAVANGAQPVVAPTDKPWGQTVSYLRDLNGCLVEIASPMGAK